MIFNNNLFPGLDSGMQVIASFIFAMLHVWEDFEKWEDGGTWKD